MAPKKSARISTRTFEATPQKAVVASPDPPPYSTSSLASSPIPKSPIDTASSNASPAKKPAQQSEDVQSDDLMLSSPISLSTNTRERSESPAWTVDPSSLMARSMLEGAYPKLLNVLEMWKADPAVAGRVAAFMEYGVDVNPFPGTFGQHLLYRKNSDTPLHIVFFGEIAPMSYGTALGAKGNHYVGSSGNRIKIGDRTKVWNVLTLRPPTDAPDELLELYKDQISFLNIIVCEDEEDREKKKEPSYEIKETVFNAPDADADEFGMCITMRFALPRYMLPSKGTTESPKKNNTNKFIRKKGTAASDIRASPGVGPSVSSSLHTVGSGGAQTQQLASLDTTYAPEIQCDYGGNIFEHQHARLRQLPIYDTEGKLVPTHEMWKELRPGTLVTLNADLVCWIYNDDDKRRKIYQLQIHFVRICAESPDEAVQPEIRYYNDIDNDREIYTGDGTPVNAPTGSNTKGKGKARGYEDALLSNLDITPTKKTRTF